MVDIHKTIYRINDYIFFGYGSGGFSIRDLALEKIIREIKQVIKDKKFILAAVLAKPGVSPYDTFLLDLGAKDGAAIGNLVFAEGDIPIGRLASVTSDTAKAVLFSSTRERTPVVIHASLSVPADLLQKGESDIFWEIIGRGGGNFEMILPRDFTLVRGDPVALPGLRSYAVAVVETILSDPRDSFKKALLRSPVNLQDLKFVEVELE